MRIIAIDQGTTSTRALILAEDGLLRPMAQRAHRQTFPAPGQVQHDPCELLANVTALVAAAKPGDLVALANQGESCLAWDARDGRPISPVIVWQDDRTLAVTQALQAAGAGPEVMARAGLPLDPYFSASKLGWIMQHIPRAQDLALMGRLRLGTTDAFFRDWLTGRFETDIATASRTSLMNLQGGRWDAELCRIFGVPISALPAITPTAGDLGRMPGGARLMASIVDQQAALYGHGCRAPGQGKLTLGTGAFVQSLTDGLLRPDQPGPLPTVAWQFAGGPVAYALDGAVYSAAAAVNWARGLGLFSDFDQIDDFDAPAAIDRGLIFLPALTGLACPHWDRRARGGWVGLSMQHGAGDLMQALLEGVALRLAEVLGAMQAHQPLHSLSVDGGLSQNRYLLRFLAGLIEPDLHLAGQTETTALGLAQMARRAEGLPDLTPLAPAATIHPNPWAAGQAATRMARFARARDDIARKSG